jgi:RHS repeat-associated protein
MPVNLALGKPASQIDDHHPVTTANRAVDGNTNGDQWNNGYTAGTNYHLNSWWQVDLQSVQPIGAVEVWGRTDCCPELTSDFYVFVSDNPFTSYDLNTTLNQAGVSNYYVSGYSGTPGTVNVNRTGRYVRVQLAGSNYLVLGEVKVLSQASGGGGSTSGNINWLVTDQLGTPRMVFDQTGSLANTKRHDYLPFGEELGANVGGRTTALGYVADNVRQKFTQKERDNETGLDFFEARYYASTQGRFTSIDPYNICREAQITAQRDPNKAAAQLGRYLLAPQQWNRYVYVANNPLKYVDPSGELLELVGDIDAEFKRIKTLVGKDAAKLLYLRTKDGHTYVDYHGSHITTDRTPNALVRAGDSGIQSFIAGIIDSKKTVEYHIADSFSTLFRTNVSTGGALCGGACTVGAEESKTGNTQIFVNRFSSAIAEGVFNSAAMAHAFSRTDVHIWAEDDVVDAHEFGHAYANAIEGKLSHNSPATDERARSLENMQRLTYPDKTKVWRIRE